VIFVDGQEQPSQLVTLDAGESHILFFTVTEHSLDMHTVTAGSFQDTFIVMDMIGEEEEEEEDECVLIFSDDTFNTVDWTKEDWGTVTTPTVVSQELQGDNYYRQMVYTHGSPTGELVGSIDLHIFGSLEDYREPENEEYEYDPRVCGAIEHLDFSAKFRLEGLAMARRFIVYQDGNWYWSVGAKGYNWEEESYDGAGDWKMWSVQLTAEDFELIILDADDPWVVEWPEVWPDDWPPKNPDFSASGEPIMFGYVCGGRSTGSSGNIQVTHSIDNWEVVIVLKQE
jgi:hypothetical protein